MAPEPEVLKRKRSRPSEWWAANSSSVESPTQQQQQSQESPAKRLMVPSNSKARSRVERNEKGIQDKPAAGNRGKKDKKMPAQDGKEIGENAAEGDELEGTNTDPRSKGMKDKPAAGDRRSKQKQTSVENEEDIEAQESEGGKRKRKRPSDWWAVDSSSLESPAQEGKQGADASLRERGIKEKAAAGNRERKQKKANENDEDELDGGRETLKPTRRGRKSLEDKQTELKTAGQNAAKKRARPTTSLVEEPEVPGVLAEDRSAPKKRGWLAKRSGKENQAPVDETAAGATPLRRSRPSNTEAELQAAAAPSSRDKDGKQNRRRSAEEQTAIPTASDGTKRMATRQSDADISVQAACSKLSRNRPRANKGVKPTVTGKEAASNSPAVQESRKNKKRIRQSNDTPKNSGPASQAPRKKLRHSSQIDAGSRKLKEVETDQPLVVKRRRVDNRIDKEAEHDEEEVNEPEDAPTYQHLAAVTRKVPRSTIEAKWASLPPLCIERISQLLQDIQRPVVVRLNDERRRTQATTALQMISRRLVSKISKGLPFPQATRNHREYDFDFEEILDHNRALEAQLTVSLHANSLLKAELSKEMAWLESEKANLETLETNAKIEASKRKQDSQKMHTLLQSAHSSMVKEDLEDDIGLRVDQSFRPINPTIQENGNLQSVVKDLQGHVDSIEGNLKQVEGITEAIAKSKAAVQSTLFGHLDKAQYEEVVLG